MNRKHIGSQHFLEPLGPLEANLLEPNPVGKKYSINTTFIEHSIKKVARTSASTGAPVLAHLMTHPRTNMSCSLLSVAWRFGPATTPDHRFAVTYASGGAVQGGGWARVQASRHAVRFQQLCSLIMCEAAASAEVTLSPTRLF